MGLAAHFRSEQCNKEVRASGTFVSADNARSIGAERLQAQPVHQIERQALDVGGDVLELPPNHCRV
jgi:hypothetical protein